jgi:hypothetical protein
MKKIIAVLMLLVVGSTAYSQEMSYHGTKITPQKAITTNELTKKMSSKDTVVAKVTGEVESVCKVKGCWMKVKLDNGQTMRVTFKDYGFFVPKDIAGKTVVFEGKAFNKEVSVKDLQHYAEDAGKSKAEIAKITKPEKSLNFVAEGVIVKK